MRNLLARFLARPAVVDWLIRRAKRTPYMHLRDTDGSVYMERYWLFNPYPPRSDGGGRKWGDWLPSIRLHKIMREDRESHMHNHPWNARTFIMRGYYWEVRMMMPRDPEFGLADGRHYCRRAGQTAALGVGDFHRIVEVSPGGVWTLFITFRKQDSWGFLVDGRLINWREYLGIPKEKI